MKDSIRFVLAVLLFGASPALAEKRDVSIEAPGGVALKASYYSPGRPGPGVLLFHMCNRDRTSLDSLATQLAARGLHVLAYDHRGHGESGGEAIPSLPLAQMTESWRRNWGPDLRAVQDWLTDQPGVDPSRLAAAGGSCGAFMSLLYASTYAPQVKGVVILSGPSDARQREFVAATDGLAVLGGASREDERSVGMVEEVVKASKNPSSRMLVLENAGHGTDMLSASPSLATTVADWMVDRLDVPSAPVAANKPSLTYLPEQRIAVLFGGYPRRGRPVAETWALEDHAWRRLDVPGPPARAAHGAAYDERRKRLVIFGGSGRDGKALNDTWEFDGAAWEQKSAEGPAARAVHRMVFDRERGRVVLFGGSEGGPSAAILGDTWEWDGASWVRRSESGPPARFEHVMAFDAKRGSILLFGGNNATDGKFAEHALGDTWSRKGTRWSEHTGPGPASRDHHAMAHHAGRGVTVLFGGFREGKYLGDTWLWDGKRWSEQAAAGGPSARGGVPAMTYDSRRGKIVMFGGWGADGALQDLWEWDGSWTRIHETVPGRAVP